MENLEIAMKELQGIKGVNPKSIKNLEQSGLVSIVVGAGAAWFGLYLGSSKSNK